MVNCGTPWSGQEVKWYWVTASGPSSVSVVWGGLERDDKFSTSNTDTYFNVFLGKNATSYS